MTKNSKISALRAALLGALMLSGAAASAAPVTESITVKGTVSSALSLDVAQEPSTLTELPLTYDAVNGQKVKVAVLTATTNNSEGLTYSVAGGTLVNPQGNTNIAFDTGLADADTQAASVVFTEGAATAASDAAGTYVQDLWISYAPASVQDPGEYSATISINVTDN